jgi:hypothetical protein
VIDTARFITSPFGRAALASILALAALTSLTLSHHAPFAFPGAAPLIVASPAAITGELA